VKTILTLLALKETVLLVSQPGYGKTSLLRELLRGIGEYTDRNRNINTRVVVVDKNHGNALGNSAALLLFSATDLVSLL
jgi:stage III sporulation protein SpoIIIAA